MLDLKLLTNELDARKEEIIGFEAESASVGRLYADKLRLIDSLDRALTSGWARTPAARCWRKARW